MPESPFRGFAPPDGGAPPVYDVIAPNRNSALDLTILDERVLGLNTHWVTDRHTREGRSKLCYAHEGDCPYCGKCPDAWLGFVAVYNHPERLRQVLRLGPDGARALVRHATRLDGLRGQRLTFVVPPERRATLPRIVVSDSLPLMPLPLPHRIDRTVCMVLGCDNIPDFRRQAEDVIALPLSAEGGGP